ncbi:MAG: hypothetical protein CSA58_07380 [Micrococcales bacterium]|nr:MAG: hypothetical protein CSB46_01355 [Micrococcales bacterium]PIE26842.1 MAG: hypothetical protein CSA58_07380 [Micrococcales bacterium]
MGAMSFLTRHANARWAAPAAVAGLIAAGAVTGADAGTGLPEKSAAQLLVDLQDPQATALSGTVVSTANLGLPELPATGGRRGKKDADLMALVSGSTTARVWVDGPARSRIAVLGQASQIDVIRNGQDMWVWSSVDRTAMHGALPEPSESAGSAPTPMPPTPMPTDPQQAAEQALDLVGETTDVSTETSVQVAGRDAYQLVLTPKQSDTLVDRVTIAMDGETNVPLRVQVYAVKTTEPAYEIGFQSVDFSTPDARQFEFTPPPGTDVSEIADEVDALPEPTPGLPSPGELTDMPARRAEHANRAEPTVVGEGWSRVLIARTGSADVAGDLAAKGENGQQMSALLTSLPEVSGAWGSGRLLKGTLFTAVLTDDGRMAIGAVPAEVLYEALGQ